MVDSNNNLHTFEHVEKTKCHNTADLTAKIKWAPVVISYADEEREMWLTVTVLWKTGQKKSVR